MYETEITPNDIKEEIDKIIRDQGLKGIIEKLNELDPISVQTLHPNDEYRLIRDLNIV